MYMIHVQQERKKYGIDARFSKREAAAWRCEKRGSWMVVHGNYDVDIEVEPTRPSEARTRQWEGKRKLQRSRPRSTMKA